MEQLTTEQRTYDWYKARFGRFTASEIHNLMGVTDVKNSKPDNVVFGKTAMSYIYLTASERKMVSNGKWDIMTDDEKDRYLRLEHTSTLRMELGKEYESIARNRFAFEQAKNITEVGSCVNSKMLYFSASPDGVIEDENALVEIKCPGAKKVSEFTDKISGNETLLNVAPDYYWQIQAQLWVTGKDKCYFVWYNPYTESLKHTLIMPDAHNTNVMLDRIKSAETLVQRIYKKL